MAEVVSIISSVISLLEATKAVYECSKAARPDLFPAGFNQLSRQLPVARSIFKKFRLLGPQDFISFERIAPGTLQGRNQDALIDTGAKNLISETFIQAHSIKYDRSSTQLITIADGSKIPTVGTVSLPWKFKNEGTIHWADFQVLAQRYCTYDVTFGMAFMKTTRTLTSFANRIIRRPRGNGTSRVLLQGGFHTRMQGYCQGLPAVALPDTCADVPLMSLEKARSLGLEIDTSKECQIYLDLPGKRVRTLGMVPDVEWRFGKGNVKDRHLINFYILSGLPADIVLDEDLLHDTDAFNVYKDYLLEPEDDWSDSEESLFLTIKRSKRGLLSRAFNKGKNDEHPTELHLWEKQRQQLLDEARTIQSSTKSDQQKQDEIQDVDKRMELLQGRKPGKGHPPTNP